MKFAGAEFQFSLPNDRIATLEFGVPLVVRSGKARETLPPPWKVTVWENGEPVHTEHGSCVETEGTATKPQYRPCRVHARRLLKQILLTAGTAP